MSLTIIDSDCTAVKTESGWNWFHRNGISMVGIVQRRVRSLYHHANDFLFLLIQKWHKRCNHWLCVLAYMTCELWQWAQLEVVWSRESESTSQVWNSSWQPLSLDGDGRMVRWMVPVPGLEMSPPLYRVGVVLLKRPRKQHKKEKKTRAILLIWFSFFFFPFSSTFFYAVLRGRERLNRLCCLIFFQVSLRGLFFPLATLVVLPLASHQQSLSTFPSTFFFFKAGAIFAVSS